MIKGEVVSFDRIKGYGFVAPESGGDDVFIHVNDLYGDKNLLSPGCIVEFRPEDGVRGLKASEVTVVQPAASAGTSANASSTTAASTSIRRVALASATATGPAPATTDSITAATPAADSATTAAGKAAAGDFEHEITEALLRVEPELTSRQILDIRKRLVRIARARE